MKNICVKRGFDIEFENNQWKVFENYINEEKI